MMLKFLPLLAFMLAVAATVWRLVAVKQALGVKAWAVGETGRLPRVTGMGFFAAFSVIGYATLVLAWEDNNRLWPHLFGAMFAGAGALVMIIAQIQMGRAWRIGIRPGDAPELVDTGLFAVSRNPIYLGMALLAVGTAIASGLWWAWVALLVFVVVTDLHIRHEESHLRENFGAAFIVYCAKVRRWI